MVAVKKDEKEKIAPIIVKRIKKGGHAHHGGAWKVAYADFVTAMMAFFLLLWLLNVTTEEQKNAISNYFDPSHPKVSDVTSGAGGILAGLSMAPVGAMVSTVQPISQPQVPQTSTRGINQGDNTPGDLDEQQLEEELRKKEDQRFQAAADKLQKEIARSEELKDLQKNLIIDITPEGLRIQIVDDQGRSMFPLGSAQMYDFMKKLLEKVTGVIVPLPNQVSVRGHTDSNKYKDPNSYDNWNLSADRAQASRRVMVAAGLPEKRIENVMGRSDREHLDAKDPSSPRNRRISIILMRERHSKEELEKLKAQRKAENAVKDAVKGGTISNPPPAKGGLQIIDDTKPQAPAAPSPAADMPPIPPKEEPARVDSTGMMGSGGTAPLDRSAHDGAAASPDGAPAPLPVAPSPQTFQRQPNVVYFGGEAPKDDSLYEGPTQSPFTAPNKPPQIRTPVINLPSEQNQQKTDSAEPVKTMEFGTPVPAPTMPSAPAALPPAPSGFQVVNPKQKSPPTVMQFGDDVAPVLPPADAPELELVNPNQTQHRILEYTDQPPAAEPAKKDPLAPPQQEEKAPPAAPAQQPQTMTFD